MRSVLAAAAGVKGALRYELVRIARLRSVRGPVFLALLASAVLTLPAARHMVGLAYPLPPASPSHSPARHSYARPGSLAWPGHLRPNDRHRVRATSSLWTAQ